MPTYTIIAEVLHTRAYTIQAEDINHAAEILRDEFGAIPYDTLEEQLDNVEVTDVD